MSFGTGTSGGGCLGRAVLQHQPYFSAFERLEMISVHLAPSARWRLQDEGEQSRVRNYRDKAAVVAGLRANI